MKTIQANDITAAVQELCQKVNFELGRDELDALSVARSREASPLCREVYDILTENAAIARQERIALCQDTGCAVLFIELGQDVHIAGGGLVEALHEGVRRGYRDGCLRTSMCDPFTRKNTGDNTPAIIHLDLVRGESLKIILAPKGGGSENMSRIAMLKPSQGSAAVKDFVVETVREAGANPCPPTIVGVGIGGNFETAALLAKKALLRRLGSSHADPCLAAFEAEILEAINTLGIGAQGFGGSITSLAVHIEQRPCHIASLPVAVNLNCHAHRHGEIIL
jgi:fumarate hydratase subunit alpha